MRILVLFNLRQGVDVAEYERWAETTDLPIVNGLSSISKFSVHAVTGLLGTDAPPPYQYFEVVDIADMDQFGKDVATETMQKVSAEFQKLADNPLFLLSRTLGERA